MRMLPPSSLTVPDMQVSRVRFFMEELCSRRCSDGRSGQPAEGDVVGVQRTGFWGTDSCGPVATAISARSSQPDGRTSLFVESCPLCRSRHSGPASSRSDGRAYRRVRVRGNPVGGIKSEPGCLGRALLPVAPVLAGVHRARCRQPRINVANAARRATPSYPVGGAEARERVLVTRPARGVEPSGVRNFSQLRALKAQRNRDRDANAKSSGFQSNLSIGTLSSVPFPRSEACRAKGNNMRTLVQPPPSSHCDLCGGELRTQEGGVSQPNP